MKSYVIDGNNFNGVETFYDECIRVFAFPDYFGRNLDALYEMLVDMDDEIEIRWKNSNKSKMDFSSDATQIGFFGTLVRTMEDVPDLKLILE